MGIIIDDILDTLLLDISSLEGTINVFSKPNVYSLKVSPDVVVPKATNTTYGVIKGSDSILINNGTPVINPEYLQGYLSLSLGPYFDEYSSFNLYPYIDSEIARILDSTTNTYLSKINDDTASGLITFNKGLLTFGYSSGMITGKGGAVDERGNAEFESLIVRSFLEVPEIRHNRETVVGMEITIGDSGIIETVTPTSDPEVFILKMKLEEGELISFWEHDIIKGIFHHSNGFYTSWFRVNSINQTEGTMVITMASPLSLSSGRNFPPKPYMNVAHRGNFINPERQSIIVLTAYEKKIIMLSGVDNYEGGFISAQMGSPKGLESILENFNQLNPNYFYVYARGLIAQNFIRIDDKDQPIKDIIDRGPWSLLVAQSDNPYRSTTTEQHEVWVGADRYRCIVDNTLDPPSVGSSDWILTLGLGDEIDFIVDGAVVKATYWIINSSSPVIYKNVSSAIESGAHTSITLKGELKLGTSSTLGGFISIQPNGEAETTPTMSPVTLSPIDTAGRTSYTIRLYDDAVKTTLLDTMTIPVVFKGSTVVSVAMSNEADVLPADAEGIVLDYANSGNIIRVFEGTEELEYDGSGTTNGTYNVVATGINIVAGSKTKVGLTCNFDNVSSLTADNASINFVITGKTKSGEVINITKVLNFTKSKTGDKGDKGDKGDLGDKGEDALSVVINVQGYFYNYYIWDENINGGTWVLLKKIMGGVLKDNVEVIKATATLKKGYVDVTADAILKGANFTWYIGTNPLPVKQGGNTPEAHILYVGIEHADGLDDQIHLEYDDTNASSWGI